MNPSVGFVALLGLTLWGLPALGASIEPSHAFSTALSVAESAMREKYSLGIEYRIFEVTRIGIGEYKKGHLGKYSVDISFFKTIDPGDFLDCSSFFVIRKVPFAKQPEDVRILEEVLNDYQIIAKLQNESIQCKK